MADALDTVTKLMALALNNPNAEEARSAALKAVQMIHEHKLLVSRDARPSPVDEHDLSQTLADLLNRKRKYAQDLHADIWASYPPPFSKPGRGVE